MHATTTVRNLLHGAVFGLVGLSAFAAGKLPEPGIPQACGMQTKSNNFKVETLTAIHQAGFRLVRRGFYWTSIEKEKGKYTFDDYDEQMNKAKELGLTVVGVLYSQHKGYENDRQGGIQTPAGRKGFAAFAAALAAHYKDHNVIWEVWNEPNVRTFWRKNGKANSPEFAAEYVALVKAVTAAMLQADPDCFVVAGSVSNYWQPSYNWTESCFKLGVLKCGIKGWSVHPYGVKTPEEFEIGHRITRNLMKKYGSPEMPLLNTERGFATHKRKEGWSGGSEAKAKEYQAWNLVRQFMIDQMCGVRLTIWYEWGGKNFGIRDKTGPNDALTAYKEMFRELNGYHFVKRIASNHYRDYLLVFAGANGARKIVAWTCPPRRSPPNKIEVHDVVLTVTDNGDLTGKFGSAQVNGAKVTIKLTGKPVYIPVPVGVEIAACVTTAKFPLSVADLDYTPPGLPEPKDLALFAAGTPWTFTKNTGDGSFALAQTKAGKAIGVLTFDFTEPQGKGVPYVLASVPCEIPKGPKTVTVQARCRFKQHVTFRLIDSSGQTFQLRSKIRRPGQWQAFTFDLGGRFEYWGGANDGIIRYPIRSLVCSVPLKGKKHKTGKVEYTDVVAQ